MWQIRDNTYFHQLSIFSTIYQKIDYSSLLVCMTRQKSTQSKSRPTCWRTNIWIILNVRQTEKRAKWEREKRKRKRKKKREKNDRYLHMYLNINMWLSIIAMVQYFEDFNFMYPFQMFVFWKRMSCPENDSTRILWLVSLEVFVLSKICVIYLYSYVLCCVTPTETDFCIMKIHNVPIELLHQ